MTKLATSSAAPVCPSPALCPLNQVKAGASVTVRQLCAPPEVNQRLREIGFTEQQQVRLVSTQQSVICMVCNARLAISQQLAETIMVEPLETGLPHKR